MLFSERHRELLGFSYINFFRELLLLIIIVKKLVLLIITNILKDYFI